jgi:hypothetical protein
MESEVRGVVVSFNRCYYPLHHFPPPEDLNPGWSGVFFMVLLLLGVGLPLTYRGIVDCRAF